MRIVILDGYTLNPGDLSWAELQELGELKVYERTSKELILERSEGSEVLFTNKTPLDRDAIMSLPKLRYIGVLATGYNVVDVKVAAERDIVVTNIPTYGTHSVVQMTFALLLERARMVWEHSEAVRNGEWASNPDFCFWKHPQVELAGKTMGIVGFGRIGRQVASIADAFGMRVLAYDAVRAEPPSLTDFAWADLPELLSQSDVVSLHCPLFPETEGIINSKTLALMKSTAFLINTSRGPLVVESDLANALNSGIIAGAGLDVLSLEPPKADNPLLTAKNCIITPHISWATYEARSRLLKTALDNLKTFLSGRPENVVS
ncbi:MAG: D-2-hydroxyacid dehydrogenase [Armatimonadota bacterium]